MNFTKFTEYSLKPLPILYSPYLGIAIHVKINENSIGKRYFARTVTTPVVQIKRRFVERGRKEKVELKCISFLITSPQN